VSEPLKAPFPWFGGKSAIAGEVWARLGQPDSYVEPFLGSAAMLLGRPDPAPHHVETVNDADGFIANFWRALQHDPEVVAYYADWPPNEADLHARHLWLIARRPRITEALMGDPHWYDPKAAGWWAWGCSLWIGSGWCSGAGPWHSVDGELVNGNPGMGVHRQSVHLGTPGMGVHRKSVHLGDPGRGGLSAYLAALAARLRGVRVNCGDWSRVVGPSALRPVRGGTVGVFLDPPYADPHAIDYSGGNEAEPAARAWAIAHGTDPDMRIAFCTYSDEPFPQDWEELRWKARGGYGGQGNGAGRDNALRERVWFSPGCQVATTQAGLAL
jgi:hypothetical protein